MSVPPEVRIPLENEAMMRLYQPALGESLDSIEDGERRLGQASVSTEDVSSGLIRNPPSRYDPRLMPNPPQRLVLRVRLADGSTHILQPDDVASEELEKAFRSQEGPFASEWISTVDDVQIRRSEVVSFQAMRAIDAYPR